MTLDFPLPGLGVPRRASTGVFRWHFPFILTEPPFTASLDEEKPAPANPEGKNRLHAMCLQFSDPQDTSPRPWRLA